MTVRNAHFPMKISFWTVIVDTPRMDSRVLKTLVGNLERFHVPTFGMVILFIYLFFWFLVVTGFETNNKYRILNSVGQQVYFALEGKHMFVNFICYCQFIPRNPNFPQKLLLSNLPKNHALFSSTALLSRLDLILNGRAHCFVFCILII